MSVDLLSELEAPVDGRWREVANQLAGALRRYTMLSEQSVEDGKLVGELKVPGDLHNQAVAALAELGELVFDESHAEAERREKKAAARKAAKASKAKSAA